jgi:hypothetical protein
VFWLLWWQVRPTRHLRHIQIVTTQITNHFVARVIGHAASSIIVTIVYFYQPIFQNVLSGLGLALGRIRLLNLH